MKLNKKLASHFYYKIHTHTLLLPSQEYILYEYILTTTNVSMKATMMHIKGKFGYSIFENFSIMFLQNLS